MGLRSKETLWKNWHYENRQIVCWAFPWVSTILIPVQITPREREKIMLSSARDESTMLRILALALLALTVSADTLPKNVDLRVYVALGPLCDNKFKTMTGTLRLQAEQAFAAAEGKLLSDFPNRYLVDPGQALGARFLEDGERRKLLSVCPVCKDASNWLRCVKNKCSGGGRRLVSVDTRSLGRGTTIDQVSQTC